MSEQEDFLKALGAHIDALRKMQGLSFAELALRSEIEKSNLVKLTSQGSNITVSSLHKIAKGLGLPTWKLLKF